MQAYQQQESDSRVSAASSISGSRMTRDIQEDSGMEEDKGGFSSSKSSTVPILTLSESLGTDPQRFSSASTTTCNSSVFNSTSFLPTVEEEKELRIDPTTTAAPAAHLSGAQSLSTHMSEVSKMSTLNTSYPPPTSSSRTGRLKANEIHPKAMSNVATNAVLDVRSNLYPYHANSSNWNPVSRQDSELQSQSSGAVGKNGWRKVASHDRFSLALKLKYSTTHK